MDKLINCGKNDHKIGTLPGICLVNPKYAENLAKIIRIASCYGIEQVWYTGQRIDKDLDGRKRLPREERMKGYQDVTTINHDFVLDRYERGVVPVAIEVRENSQSLVEFEHPENALYMFGPEDGSIDKVWLQHCHHFVVIPTRHCLNLATAVATVMWDRQLKHEFMAQTTPGEYENRGYIQNQS